MKLALLGAALALGAAVAQDTVKLELKAKKGDKYTFSLTQSTAGKIQVGAEEFPLKEKQILKYEDEVLEVEGAEPSRVRRQVVEWYKANFGEGAAPTEKQVRQLQGKTFVLKKNGDKTEYEKVDGLPAAELRQHQLRPDAFLTNLPKIAVAIGHEWNLDEKRLLEEFSATADGGSLEFKTAKGAARLEKLEDYQGVRCGLVAIDLTGDGQVKEDMDVKIAFKMKVRIRLAIETGRLLTIKGSGAGEMSGKVDAGGEKATLSGSFTFATDGEVKYQE